MPSASMLISSVALVLFMILDHTEAKLTSCEYEKDSCGCRSNYGLISLKQFEKKPLTAIVEEGPVFAWSPCKDITVLSTTAASIESFPTSLLVLDCGTHESTKTSVENGNVVFSLEAEDKSRRSKITCICGIGDKYEFLSEDMEGDYEFQLTSKACCPPKNGKSSGGLSTGTILVIVFFCAVVIYLIAGIFVQVGLKSAEGKERIPNFNFWTTIPGLIVDGCRFVFTKKEPANYNALE
ncbi:cation-dependent mannose-6-phosphate receptor [Plakobranchus ocellatus]|uniref:Cation-dependent mannose-6-phosphate receptor n=1 Tax=Plakobranchus ocellatus TaxID=259542 RepID=A0AAV4DN35_9GAST|nr:cation-dependent mannose-6-phosphate receptor [Plakobranchus ocellatus]